ncbi:ankyrin repeat domain-containing protein [Marinobacter sp. S6332]|uniref:ankyrin repeat domain-containing protein n=1 Tax=Marinobacter sp. S6332 TaxID=2926403 RepID=UPI001FF2634C|nr:ankyrin repeat domain-containing protein [Marinobacter sp. S6332]MCK0165895.1 ankyrin repeat domain-containing protein [Marinobacter sp. S6332]
MDSISEHDIATAEKMIQKGINPFKTDDNGQSAVSLGLAADETTDTYQWANALANESSVKAKELLALIKSGNLTAEQFQAELEKASFYIDAPVDNHGSSLLTTLAESTEHVELITPLINFDANLDHKIKGGYTALTQATYFGQVEVIKALISAGANLDTKADTGWAALHFTANPVTSGNRTHDVQIAQMLIDAGADLNVKNSGGATPLYLSVWNNRAAVQQTLHNANANPDIPDNQKWTPLMQAVFNGNTDAAQALITAGAQLEAKSDKGWTALHYAANTAKNGNRTNDAQLAQMLIDAGADRNPKNNSGATPLYLTVLNDRATVRQTLLNTKASPNIATEQEWTPLIRAVFDGNTDAAQALITAGANVNIKNENGWSALHFTANTAKNGNRTNDAQLAQMLINAGADRNARNNSGATPLYLTVLNDRATVRQTLLNAKASPDITAEQEWTPLIRAVFDGNTEAAQALVAAGARLEAKSDKGWTALHLTANSTEYGNRANDIDIAKVLIRSGANPNNLNDELVTPLMHAGINNRQGVAKVLLKNGARTDIKNKFGRTAEEEAIRADNYRIVPLIREFQPKQAANTSATKKRTSLYPSAPAPRAGYTTCNTRCSNGDCYRTYSDGRKTRFQAERKYNPFSSQWEYDSGSC